ncbi:hypothetical protein PYW08_005088 [Mythimna loreyi]|uniref:Uncharacterized protein n=1 Tax=Mythimna loreyi TaxID=667449 RepID=A0ACC2QGQ3_9NEOP|nr:hypothetical protein PYW08_005088 [Mythimna loreyi]
MYSIMASFLIWIMLIHKQDCAVIHIDGNNQDTFEFVLQKYMNPLRRLAADLPNHEIEMEINFQDSIPTEETPIPQRRVIRLVNSRHPKRGNRSRARGKFSKKGEKKKVSTAEPATSTATAPAVEDPTTEPSTPAPPTSTPPTPAPTTPATTTSAPATPAAATPAPDPKPPDASKIPVFMEDLLKAIKDLESKLHSKQSEKPDAMLNRTVNKGHKVKKTIKRTDAEKAPSIKSIDAIIDLLQRAQELDQTAPIAGQHIDWVRIKIPKRDL